jgi:hypothetical protein
MDVRIKSYKALFSFEEKNSTLINKNIEVKQQAKTITQHILNLNCCDIFDTNLASVFVIKMDIGVHLLNLSIIKFNQENSCLKLTSLFRAKIN